METIIQQITVEMARKLFKKVEEGGLCDIDRFSTESLEICKESVREMIAQLGRLINEELRCDKKYREEQGLLLKEKERERWLLTEIGHIRIQRDYYRVKDSGKYVCPLDEMFGIASYERISPTVSAKMVERAAEMSYEKSARGVTDAKVSKQTVKNKLHEVGRLEKDLPREKRSVRELHVFADEDHAHLRNGQSRIVPLITVSEGVRKVSASRNALVNPVHFASTSRHTGKAWEAVAGYIETAYVEKTIECIYLHGDGAAWIKRGLEELPKSLFVLDGFHLEERLRSVTAAFHKYNYHFRIRQAMFEKKEDKVQVLFEEMLSQAETPQQAKRIRKVLSYIKDNWDGIVCRQDGILGSCTEGLISHVYAERLSRNPMAWSEKGLDKMAELRVYTRNGCCVSADAFRRSREEKERSALNDYAKERLKDAVCGQFDWSIFDKDSYIPAVNSPTQILIRAYGRQNNFVG